MIDECIMESLFLAGACFEFMDMLCSFRNQMRVEGNQQKKTAHPSLREKRNAFNSTQNAACRSAHEVERNRRIIKKSEEAGYL